ncbi:hypothetical protein T440DRAFT_471690 [Plenodomus tracheiphilus IPT5]|uniref:Uncharacterized protein n=1 Tax=Plenodomus tracheiphilus IPT5 TaxID=1408161 RepID=A0A6A7AWT0_9PLEO|nr:hypothetical protein T440DRAFT_471690 [Plenodomus tracheiphilus IPT5]
MQSFHIVKDRKSRMEVPSIAKQDPFTTWHYGSYLIVRIAMIAFQIKEAQSWLWFDTVFVVLLGGSLWSHFRQPRVLVI